MLLVLVGPRQLVSVLWELPVRVLHRWFPCRLKVVVLLGSCSLSFSHLWWFSPNQVLAHGNLFLGHSGFTPSLEPVAGPFLAGQLDPSIAAASDISRASLRYRGVSRLSLDPGGRKSVPGLLVRDYDLCCEVLPCEPPRRVESKSKIALR